LKIGVLLLSHRGDVEIDNLRSALCEVHHQNKSFTSRLHEQGNMITQLQFEMGEVKETIARLEDELWKEKAKTRKLWHHQCDQLALHETTTEEKDTEIACLREKLLTWN